MTDTWAAPQGKVGEILGRSAWSKLDDLRDRDLLREFLAWLETPAPIHEVERLEMQIKRLWLRALSELPFGAETHQLFVDFFHSVGFLRKYKSYGVKFATPFGYSLFWQEPGEGFSFQRHRAPKYEVFHMLSVGPGAGVYLSSMEQWQAEGLQAVEEWARSGWPIRSRWAYVPRPGDVVEVSARDVVHTVLGCFVEEFASCSIDVVDRLFDQNQGRPVLIPGTHPSLPELLRSMEEPRMVRRAVLGNDGWLFHGIRNDRQLARVTEGGLCARHLTMRAGSSDRIFVGAGRVGLVACLVGTVECKVAGRRLKLRPGSVAPIPPAAVAALRADSAGCSASVHIAPVAAAFGEWTEADV